MAKVKVIHDKVGETLTVYFEDPTENQLCEETGEGVVLIKNRDTNKVIGFEKLYFQPDPSEDLVLESQVLNHDLDV